MQNQLLEQILGAIPFNRHLGLVSVHADEHRGVVRMPEAEPLKNHVGTVHAGALFTVAEAASGAAVIGAFGPLLGSVTTLARDASITYLKRAVGEITATASLAEPAADVVTRLERDGKAVFEVGVELTDPTGVKVAAFRINWHLRKMG